MEAANHLSIPFGGILIGPKAINLPEYSSGLLASWALFMTYNQSVKIVMSNGC